MMNDEQEWELADPWTVDAWPMKDGPGQPIERYRLTTLEKYAAGQEEALEYMEEHFRQHPGGAVLKFEPDENGAEITYQLTADFMASMRAGHDRTGNLLEDAQKAVDRLRAFLDSDTMPGLSEIFPEAPDTIRNYIDRAQVQYLPTIAAQVDKIRPEVLPYIRQIADAEEPERRKLSIMLHDVDIADHGGTALDRAWEIPRARAFLDSDIMKEVADIFPEAPRDLQACIDRGANADGTGPKLHDIVDLLPWISKTTLPYMRAYTEEQDPPPTFLEFMSGAGIVWAEQARENVAAFMISPEADALRKDFPDLDEWAEDDPWTAADLAEIRPEIPKLMPFLRDEVEKQRQVRNFGDRVTFGDVMNEVDPETGREMKSMFSRARDHAAGWKGPKGYPLDPAIMIDPITQAVRNYEADGHEVPITRAGEMSVTVRNKYVTPKGKVFPEISVPVRFESLALDCPLGADHVDTLEGIATLIENRQLGPMNMTFTAADIFRAKNGLPANYKVTVRQIERVEASLEYLRDVTITADVSQQMSKMGDGRYQFDGIAPTKNYRIKGHMLDYYEATETTGGEHPRPTGPRQYLLLHYPPLYVYAKTVQQMSIIAAEHMAMTRHRSDIALRLQSYTLRRIQVMRHDLERTRKNKKAKPKQDTGILFSTLYANCGIDPTNWKATSDARETEKDILNDLQATGFIAGYEFKRSDSGQGRGYYKIEIELP